LGMYGVNILYPIATSVSNPGDMTMKSNKWSKAAPVQPKPQFKVVWDKFDDEASRDADAIQRANASRVRRPRRVK